MLPMGNRSLDASAVDEDNLTVVADAGMFSAANKQYIINAGMHYIPVPGNTGEQGVEE